jgi:hypothetical protein
MAKREEQRQSRPATTPEARESQLVNAAVNLAEKQLQEGTASSAVIVHYLKLASARERLEREILEKNAKLLDAKANHIEKERESESVAKDALEAMKNYTSGSK